MAASGTQCDFMILLADLAAFLRLTDLELQEEMEKNNLYPVYVAGRAYLMPETVRLLLLSCGYKYGKKVISVQMLKGGVAKTTTAVNMGIRANMYGAKVLLVDLDQQANLSFALGVEDPDHPVWVDLLEGKTGIRQLIREITPSLHLIPSNLNNSVLERVLLNGKRNIGTAVSQYLNQVRDDYDLIIIDTAPSLSAINTAVSCASDVVLSPVNPDKFSFVGLLKTLEDLDNIRDEFHADFATKILFTKFDGRETASRELLKHCFERFGDQMLSSFVRTSTDVKNTIRTKKTVFDFKSNAKTDYDLVTREVLGLDSSDEEVVNA